MIRQQFSHRRYAGIDLEGEGVPVGDKIYDLMRPSLTQDGIVSEEIQRESLEHVVDRAGLKEPPRLDKIFESNKWRGRGA